MSNVNFKDPYILVPGAPYHEDASMLRERIRLLLDERRDLYDKFTLIDERLDEIREYFEEDDDLPALVEDIMDELKEEIELTLERE